MSDFSPKYFSDCASTSEYRSYNNRTGKRGGRSSVCPSDSESDMENISVHQRHRHRNVDSEDERPLNAPLKVMNVNSLSNDLRKISSHQAFAQSESDSKLHDLISYKDFRGDETEDFGEEKTIKAVYSQMKSLQTNPPVGDSGTSDFLEAMRSEVQRVVAEIRIELEESMRKNCKPPEASHEGNSQGSHGKDVIQAVADIRKEYSIKLEQSEKRVRELWSQLAVEERRCLELARIVKELLPMAPSPGTTATSQTSSSRRRSHRRKNSAEKQVNSISLEDEALKYFDECVSISPLVYQGDSDDSSHENQLLKHTNDGSLVGTGETVAKFSNEVTAEDTSSMFQAERRMKGRLVGSDGVVLPWLQWGAEAGASDKNLKKVGKRHTSPKGSSNSILLNRKNTGSDNVFYRNSHVKLSTVKKLTSGGQGSIDMDHTSHTSMVEMASGPESDKLLRKTIPENSESVPQAPMPLLFVVNDKMTQKECSFPDIDSLLFEKIMFSSRVGNGELLLCQGLFL